MRPIAHAEPERQDARALTLRDGLHARVIHPLGTVDHPVDASIVPLPCTDRPLDASIAPLTRAERPVTALIAE